MFVFPTAPVDPRVFFEESIPALFADLDLDDVDRALDLCLGVVLLDEEGVGSGGEWTLHFVDGELGIQNGRGPACDFTIVQRVGDWRSALWEGRPGLIADAVAALVESGPATFRMTGSGFERRRSETIKGLSDLQGLIEAVIAEDGDGEEHDDWRIGVQIGPGPIPETAQATIRLGADQADAIRRGDLHPVEALITGQLRLEGDLGLILQLQALAMLASMPAPSED